MRLGLDLNLLTHRNGRYLFFGVTRDRKGWAIPSSLAQCELEGFCWTWSSSGVSDCAFPISLNFFGIVAVVLDSLKPRHHGMMPYPRRYPTTYLCESGFSRYANLTTKCQCKLDATPDIRIKLRNIKPNFWRILMSKKQMHTSFYN